MHTLPARCYVVITHGDGRVAALQQTEITVNMPPSLLNALCARVLENVRTVLPADASANACGSPLDEAFLAQLTLAIDEQLPERQFNVERLAAHLSMSARHLRRRLAALTGETPHTLLRRRRVEQAEMLLRSGAPSVKEVAHAVGYSGAKSLYRAFIATRGTPPSTVRRT